VLKKFLRAGIGGLGAQAISLLTLPVISRLYPPEMYAIWAIFMAIAGIFGSIASFRYELAIVIPKDEEDASSIFCWCAISSVGMGLFVAFLVQMMWFQNLFTSQISGDGGLYLLLIPALVASMGLVVALHYWNVRQANYTLNSFAQISLVLATVVIQITWIEMYPASPGGLLVGSLVGQIVAMSVLIIFSRNPPKINKTILKKIPGIMNQQRKFFFYSTPYILFAEAKARGSIFILEYFLAGRVVGLYAFSYRIMNFPLSLISSALRPVLFQETASKGIKSSEGKIGQILKYLATITVPFLAFYFFYAEWLFASVFGKEWEGSGYIGKFLILPVFTYLFCNWMDRIMDVMGKQRLLLSIEAIFGSLSILGLWLGFVSGLGLIGALSIQSVILIVYNITYLYIAYDRAGYDKKKIGQLFCQVLIWTSICTFVLFLLGGVFTTIFVIPLYFLTCFFIFLWFRKSKYEILNRLLI